MDGGIILPIESVCWCRASDVCHLGFCKNRLYLFWWSIVRFNPTRWRNWSLSRSKRSLSQSKSRRRSQMTAQRDLEQMKWYHIRSLENNQIVESENLNLRRTIVGKKIIPTAPRSLCLNLAIRKEFDCWALFLLLLTLRIKTRKCWNRGSTIK